jgi:sporadic carbohydrate cluster 2OG-Fe(II) oxygenase
MSNSTEKLTSTFETLGYCHGKLQQQDGVAKIRSICKTFLQEKLRMDFDLIDYHLYVQEEQHRELHYELTQHIRNARLQDQIVAENLSLFKSFLGNDIDIQTECYLRISRPGMDSDNIGMHRDTHYGNSAYEVSSIYPLVDFVEGAAVGIIPGSYKYGELELEQIPHKTITKGSKQNQLGFLYSTKKIKGLDESKIIEPLVRFGEFLLFSLGTIHGQVVNTSNTTRWSIDFRLKNHFTPLNASLKPGYYRFFCESSVSKVAREYYQYCLDEKKNLKVVDASE